MISGLYKIAVWSNSTAIKSTVKHENITVTKSLSLLSKR